MIFYNSIISSVNQGSFISSFPNCMPFIFFFACLRWLEPPGKCKTEVRKTNILALFPVSGRESTGCPTVRAFLAISTLLNQNC